MVHDSRGGDTISMVKRCTTLPLIVVLFIPFFERGIVVKTHLYSNQQIV